MNAAVRPELIDRMIELYCDWRTDSAEVQAAYDRFCGARAEDRSATFAVYRAALDREQRSCEAYAAQIRVIERRCADAGRLERRSSSRQY